METSFEIPRHIDGRWGDIFLLGSGTETLIAQGAGQEQLGVLTGMPHANCNPE
jgi:hypothetical protein